MVNFLKLIRDLHSALLFDKKENLQLYFILFLMIFGAFLEMIGIGILLPYISVVFKDENFTLFDLSIINFLNNLKNPIILMTIILIGFFFLKNIFLSYMHLAIGKFVYKLNTKISKTLYETYLNQSFKFHLDTNSSILMRNTHYETTQLILGAVMPILIFFSQLFIVIFLSALLIIAEPIGFIIAFVSLISSGYIFTKLVKKYTLKWGSIRHHFEALRIRELHHGFFGIKELKILKREKQFVDTYEGIIKNSEKAAVYHYTISNLPKLFLELIIISIIAFLIIFYEYFKTDINLYGIMSLALLVAIRLLPVFALLISSLNSINYSSKTISTLLGDIKKKTDFDFHQNQKFPQSFKKSISIKNLSFNYGNKEIFKNISLEINKHEFLSIIGQSGSGKTTLVNIILGLLSPSSCDYYIDSDLLDENSILSSLCSYVPQDIFLLDKSIKENITYYEDPILFDEEKFNSAIESSQLLDFIGNLDQKENTIVGEKGVKISGGQRQRIGIARALYKKSQLLILDEASSSLDPATEKNFLDFISKLKKYTTIIFISHNDIVRDYADKTIYLNKGSIEYI